MTAFLGFDVLDAVRPNTRETPEFAHERSQLVFDPGTGRRALEDLRGGSILTWPFPWFLGSRAEIAAFRTWFDSRRGRAVPFWVPTWRRDLVLAQEPDPAGPAVIIRSSLYALLVFSANARRHLAFIEPGGAMTFRTVIAAVDSGDGTETLTLDTPVPRRLPLDTWIAFLVMARLDSDEAELEWHGTESAEVRLALREVPKEAP